MYKPEQLPKAPWRAYDDWQGWPAFLGNENQFKNANPHQYRSFAEALQYAHTTGIKTAQEWYKADHPDDIPVRPEIVYRGEFLGWYSFLGTGPSAIAKKMAARQQAADLGVLVLNIPHGNPSNVIHGFVAAGKADAIDKAKQHGFRVVKMFKLEPDYDWKEMMNRHGSLYGDDEWIVRNVNELLWDYSNDLLFVQ